jgi:small acid-soluble spore protein H (minor)
MNMNVNRAREISQSGQPIQVTYKGENVYIQHVNEQNETARIYFEHDREKEKEVPVQFLEEKE